MKYPLYLLIAFLAFVSCSSSKNWQGTSDVKGTQAQFDELNGKQTFTLLVPDEDTYLKYHFKVNSGKLVATIQSPEKMLLSKELDKMEMDSIHVVNQKGAQYQIHVKGQKASGEFDVRFTPALN